MHTTIGGVSRIPVGLLGIVLLHMLLISPVRVAAQDNLRNVPNPYPQYELETLNVADGFEVNLFADEPMLVKPIQMNWDAQGRLWVVGSEHYPQLKPGEVPNDKIYVLEDTTGDGKADVSTVFAEGLHIPTGVLPGDGGAYVANATEILHLKDTNGDGKADQRRKVLTGFGTGDTHHLVHTFRWGPAGRFYFNQSIYIHSRVETPHGVKELKGGGVWRFQPETMELGVYARGLVNPWGLRFNKWGQSFLTDGAGREGINYAFPGATFVSAPGAERILEGLNPGQPKHSGLEIISGRHFPDSLAGSFITNDFRANRINRFVLEEQGSGYVSNQAEDLLWSDNVAFRPVDISIGPDGAIYVADWYNPIIQHGEVDFRDPRRDHTHGRIWRITAKDRPLVDKPELKGASTGELLDALKRPEKWTRSQAKRLLKERGGEEVVPELKSWVDGLDASDSRYEQYLLEALWVFQSVDAVNQSLLEKTLHAGNHQVRAAAVRVLNYWYENIDNAARLLEQAVRDDHAKVRLEAVITLRNQQNATAAATALSVLDDPMDTFLDFALWQTVRELEPYWMERLQTDSTFLRDPRKRAYALKSVPNPEAVGHLLTLYQQGEMPEEYNEDLFNSVARWGTPEDLAVILDLATSDADVHRKRRASYLASLAEAARQRKVKPAEGIDRIIDFIDSENVEIARHAVRLTGYWNLEHLREDLADIAKTGKEALRPAAIDALASLGGEESLNMLAEMSGSGNPDELRIMAAEQLVRLDLEKAASNAVQIFRQVSSQAGTADLFSAFFSQEGGIEILAEKLSSQEIPKEIALEGRKLMERQIPFNRREDEDVEALRQAFEASGGELPPERMPQELTSQQFNRLELDVKASADPARGEMIYRELNCESCHAIGGAGGLMGPDLSSLGANAPTDYIINGILNPSEDIKDGYELYRVVRQDGSEVRGYIVNETSSELILRDISGDEISIPVNQIEKQEVVPGSLMPPGLTAGLERQEFVDLIGFLSKLGETGEYRVPNEKLVRRWRTLPGNEEIVGQINKTGINFPAQNRTELSWQPAYSKVSGDLPVKELPVMEVEGGQEYSFVRFELEVLSGGNVEFVFNSTEGITAWAGEEMIKKVNGSFTAELTKGTHEVTLAINRDNREEPAIRIEVREPGSSPAQTRLIMGS
ncbi:PVC-type heme-binding CxxCH protein [Halalkalibaculum sp. DA384]|uniref:PVC-type heme-binding CxxCH protein n=1 Tax=Halalkalibaculum sp. DA384 TaxID=3373606 RepID=UPI0037542521